MVLAVDIGNSNIVIGCFQDSSVLFEERISTNLRSTSLEYAVTIHTLLQLNRLHRIAFEGGIVSSVVPSVTPVLCEAIRRVIEKEPLVVGPGVRTGLNILLDNPGQLGSDSVANAVGAIRHYTCPLIIADMNTATTISVLDRNRNFLGGMIIPGLRVSLDSLTDQTAQLPRISLDPPKKIIGTNTVDCMKSGILYGGAAAIDGVMARIEAELGQPCTKVATGPLAADVIPFCRADILLDEQLLLKGLMAIYQKNR